MKQHTVDVFVIKDDGSDDYEDVRRDPLIKLFYDARERCGKENYWRLINEGLYYIRPYKNDYDLFIKTDDDMVLCEDFFDHCLKYWNKIKSPTTFSLDILSAPRQRGKTLRGHAAPVVGGLKDGDVFLTQWVDMNFIFNIEAFEKINFEITNCNSNARSSGVGLWLTRKFYQLQYNMFQMPFSLLSHGDHPSKMHEAERINKPIITNGMK
jgi:hypothetical protein